MAQNRQPPAYQEYASSIMARVEYRVMRLDHRGLLYTMRLECWVNHTLPENPEMLSKILGFDAAEIASALPSVLPFFTVKNGLISCPELDDYREHINGIRNRQSEGGKQGAAVTNAKSKRPEKATSNGFQGKSSGYSSSEPSCNLRVESRVLSTVQPSHEGGNLLSIDSELGAGAYLAAKGGSDDF